MRLSSAGDPMIYRSRYLDRMLFSPLGYKQDSRLPHTKRRGPRGEVRETPRESLPEASQNAGAASTSSYHHQSAHLGERASYLSSRELRDVISRCEKTITSGQAQIEDYEAFVICQQELGSRA